MRRATSSGNVNNGRKEKTSKFRDKITVTVGRITAVEKIMSLMHE
jgi:hypothetical protein